MDNSLSSPTAQSQLLHFELSVRPLAQVQDIVYAQRPGMGSNRVLKLDLLQPLPANPMSPVPEPIQPQPAVVFVTGGGFLVAPKASYLPQRLALAQAGYVVASIEYRLLNEGGYAAAVADVKSAIRFLRANATQYGIDPTRIAVMGESAGGYLSAFTATSNGQAQFEEGEHLDQSSEVQAAVDLYGLSDLTRVGEGLPAPVAQGYLSPSSLPAVLVNGIPPFGPGGALADTPERAAAANPMTYISEHTPPFLLMHGDKDTLVSPGQTQLLFEALHQHQIPATRYVVQNAGHADAYWYQPEIINLVIKFLDEVLK